MLPPSQKILPRGSKNRETDIVGGICKLTLLYRCPKRGGGQQEKNLWGEGGLLAFCGRGWLLSALAQSVCRDWHYYFGALALKYNLVYYFMCIPISIYWPAKETEVKLKWSHIPFVSTPFKPGREKKSEVKEKRCFNEAENRAASSLWVHDFPVSTDFVFSKLLWV